MLKSQLYNFKMIEKKNIEEQLRKVNNIIGQFANIGIEMLDKKLVD